MNLRNQAELYFAEEINDTNQWQISVLQLWTLLKAFQNEFSLSMCQSIEDGLRRTIQSLQIETIGERLSWLTCLDNILHSLVSKQLIERELNSTGPVLTPVVIGECALFLRTIEKSKMLLKLLVQFVLNNDSIDVNDCYEKTTAFVDRLETIFQSICSTTAIQDGHLDVSSHYSAE